MQVLSKSSDVINILKQTFVPPGEGVYTVHTGKERKEQLQKSLFASIAPEKVRKAWLEKLSSSVDKSDNTFLFGLCNDSGGGILRGANWGPLFVRDQLLLDNPELIETANFSDLGDVRVIPHFLHDKYLNKETIQNARKALYGDSEIDYPVSPLSLTEFSLNHLRKYRSHQGLSTKILALGGDHSVSYPLVKTYLEDAKARGKTPGLIHFDAHTDLLRERLGVDICFASWVPHILEYLPSSQCVHQIGIRSSGKEKSHWEKVFGLYQYWGHELHENNLHRQMELIKERLHQQKVNELYISFDIDALGSEYASATGTPEEGGLSPDQAAYLIREICHEFPLGSADLAEVAPFLKTEGSQEVEPDSTLMCASALCSLFLEFMQTKDGQKPLRGDSNGHT